MKLHKKILSLVLSVSTLFCCFTNLYVKAADIDVSNYTYVVDNMTFYKGDEQINSLEGATEVAVDVTRRVAGGGSDRLIISTYTNSGEFIGMNSVTHHIGFGETSNVKVFLNVPQGKTVGEIKAYVWKSFSDMTPLSNALSSKNNMIIDPKLESNKKLQTKFPDVSANDSYANAVSLLAASGIMNGYEDGTFRPAETLRVADAARLITYMTKGQASASILADETLVTDEIPSSIERGYINYCVDAGYLTPDENGYANYNENITTGEFLKLTVNALGYSNLATVSGGWPRGYISVATQYGIADVSDLNYSDPITRSTAAEILYSAINAPIAQVVDYSYDASGALIPKIQIQDGVQSSYYQSMLTKNFNIYKVDGYVVATHKDGKKVGQVDFAIAKTQKYNQDDVCILNAAGKVDNVDTFVAANVAGRLLTNVKVAGTDAADYKGVYATAYIKLDENKDWEFVQFIPSDKNVVHTLDLNNLDDGDYDLSGVSPYLKFFAENATTSTKYLLDNWVRVYVNGVEVTWGTPIVDYVINGDIGEVELVDTYKTNGKIDTIYVNKYVSGMFAGITSAGKISFTSPDAGLSQITLDDEDESLEYNIYYNGEKITVDDLQKNDVLTIAYDVTAASVRDSTFYEIYVSRDAVTDTLKGKDAENYAVKIGDTYYTFASSAKYTAFASALLGDKYTIYLDAFGRIFKAEQSTSSVNWAIAEKFTISVADDDYKLTMFTADGTEKTYYFDTNATVTLADGTVIDRYTEGSANALNAAVKALVYTSGTTRTAIENRVIQYKVRSSTGKIHELKFMPVVEDTIDTGITKEEYKERNNTIGNIRLGEVTKIVDATKYYDRELSTMTWADFVDEVEYKAYAYGAKIDGIHPFVLITEGDSAYNKRTRFAVITEDGYKQEIDEETGDIIDTISALYGDAEKLVVSDDVATATLNGLKKGEVIFFKTNAAGQVTAIDKLFAWTNGAVPTQANLADCSLVDTNTAYANLNDEILIESAFGGNFSTDFTTDWDSTARDAIKVVYGPIMEKTSNDISFGKVNSGYTNLYDDVSIFTFSDDIRVYTYDYSKVDNQRFNYNGSDISAIIPTYILEENVEADGITVDWNKTIDGSLVNQEFANFAFAIVVNDEIQDIFTFITDSEITIPDSPDEEITFNENFAIAEKFTLSSADDEYKLTMFTDDGETKAYYFDADNASVTKADGTVIDKDTEGSADALNAAVKALVYTSGTTRTAIEDRIIQYKLNSAGKIRELKFMPVVEDTIDTGITKEEYDARTNTIGSIRLGENTKIIDATKYADKELSPATYAGFTDGVEYKAYAYGTTINGIHPFVLVTEGEAAYTASTRFAVITEDGYNQEIDEETGDLIYSISAMCGDAESLVVSEEVSSTVLNSLVKGEVIFFKTNAAGQVTAIDKLFAWANGAIPTQANLADWSLVALNTAYANLATNITIQTWFGGNFSSDFTTDWDSTSRDAIKIVYGPVIGITDHEISFGKVDSRGMTNTETDVSIYSYSDDIRVYTYDYAQGTDYRFEYQANAISAVPATTLLEAYMEDDGVTVDWSKMEYGEYVNREYVTFAFATVVNDEIQDIFAFLPK